MRTKRDQDGTGEARFFTAGGGHNHGPLLLNPRHPIPAPCHPVQCGESLCSLVVCYPIVQSRGKKIRHLINEMKLLEFSFPYQIIYFPSVALESACKGFSRDCPWSGIGRQEFSAGKFVPSLLHFYNGAWQFRYHEWLWPNILTWRFCIHTLKSLVLYSLSNL